VTKRPLSFQALAGTSKGPGKAGYAMRGLGYWVLSWLGIVGCGGHSLDIGSNDGGAGAEADSVSLLPLGPDADTTTQVWIGRLEKNQFQDGSSRMSMTIDFAPGGLVTGTILLGNGALLAPPTDPNAGYPPGTAGLVTLVEGFPYTLQNGTLQASHLTLQFSLDEVWAQWCSIQTPRLATWGMADGNPPPPPDVYDCLGPLDGAAPNGSFSVGPTGCGYELTDGGTSSVDCAKFMLCGAAGSAVCQCSAAGCRVPESGPIASLDLVLMITQADGSLSGTFGDYPVRFTRSQ
jgi:hypothetical protein